MRRVGLAGAGVAALLAAAAEAGVDAATVVGLGRVAGGLCGALLAPAEAVNRRARLAPIYPGAGLAALGLAGLALVAVDWLVLRRRGRRSRSALVAGAAAIAYVAGGALGAWLVTGRLQARQRGTEKPT